MIYESPITPSNQIIAAATAKEALTHSRGARSTCTRQLFARYYCIFRV
jgi:hypothetical protein